ncbi:MAG TPA: primosomal replication protein N [Noviherbaspirillum sp.]|nr:primosomal replication protein N [Noviherbaspirillum sp.]
MNQLRLLATISERDVMRYTPAGVPIVSAKLLHDSEQVEAGILRRVEFEIAAIAAGEISGRFNRAELGAVFQFTGFLARKNRNSRSFVFHLTDFEAHTPDH